MTLQWLITFFSAVLHFELSWVLWRCLQWGHRPSKPPQWVKCCFITVPLLSQLINYLPVIVKNNVSVPLIFADLQVLRFKSVDVCCHLLVKSHFILQKPRVWPPTRSSGKNHSPSKMEEILIYWNKGRLVSQQTGWCCYLLQIGWNLTSDNLI